MNKKWIIGIVILLAIGGVLLYVFFGNVSKNNNQSEYTPSRVATNQTINNNSTNSDINNIDENNKTTEKKKTETKISSFTTPIVDDNKNRINNIKITCSRISDTIVKAHDEFSFCDVVGQPSSDDGYKEAHAFVDGKLTNAIRWRKLPSKYYYL